jgi:hypothetical protein
MLNRTYVNTRDNDTILGVKFRHCLDAVLKNAYQDNSLGTNTFGQDIGFS